jgi:hypothetical protein
MQAPYPCLCFNKAALALLLCALLASCAHAPHAGGVMDTLYFGLSRPGGQVSESEWQEFMNTEISSRFPDGFTIVEGKGQRKNKNGEILSEATKILQLGHDGSEENEAKFRQIIDAYKKNFDQESVYRSSQKANISY